MIVDLVKVLTLILILTLTSFGWCGIGIAQDTSIFEFTSTLEHKKRYDDLLQVLERFLAETDVNNYEQQLYILDDVAEIYTTGLVDFKKAIETNEKAQETLYKIKRLGLGNLPVSPYFNQRRSFYHYIYCNLYPAALADPNKETVDHKKWQKLQKEHSIKIEAPSVSRQPGSRQSSERLFYTSFDTNFLNHVRQKDLAETEKRVKERRNFLDQLLGRESSSKQMANAIHSNTTVDEARIKENLLINTGIYNPYYLNYYMASHAWSSFMRSGDKRHLTKLISYGDKAIDNEKIGRLPEDFESLAYLNYWLGIACIESQMYRRGAESLELFDKLIENHQKVLQKKEAIKQDLIAGLKTDEKVGAILGGIAGSAFSVLAMKYSASHPTPLSQFNINQSADNLRKVPGAMITEFDRIHRNSNPLIEISKYQSPYAVKLNIFLNRHEQLIYFMELGDAYRKTLQIEKAIAQYKEAIMIIENQRETISVESQRIGFLRDREEIYRRIVPLLVMTGKVQEAFEYVERAKSRSFIDLMGNKQVTLKSNTETEAYSSMLRQKNEIDLILSQRNISVDQYNNILLRSAAEDVKTNGRGPNIEFVSLTSIKTLSCPDILRLIGEKTAIVEYFLTSEELIIFVLAKGKIHAVLNQIKSSDLFEYVQKFRTAMQNPSAVRSVSLLRKSPSVSGNSVMPKANALYKILVQPIRQWIDVEDIYIVPHDCLHYLPYQALYDGKRYLIDTFSISYLPSSTVLKYVLEKKKYGTKKIAVFANPDLGDTQYDLPYAQEEARGIKNIYPDSLILSGKDITKTKVVNALAAYNVIHFATHGDFDVTNPFNASLLLSRDGKDDGRLTMAEVFGLTLNADMVVLSACKTGLSKVSPGNELIGFARGFFYAGTPTVIASLWNVDDHSTAYLMTAFYKKLNTMSKAKALQSAQIETMRQYPDPYYWAPFVLMGYNE